MSTSKSLGRQIDNIYRMDAEISKANATVAELKRVRRKAESRLLKDFDKSDIDGASGTKGKASIRRSRHATIKNRAKLDKWIRKHNAFDLYQARLTSKAYFDRLEEGITVPGVGIFEDVRVSISRRRG